MQTRTDNRRLYWIALLLAVLTFAAYCRVLNCQFITMYDDGGYVLKNADVQKGLTGQSILWAFGFHQYNWHPLTWMSHMLDCQLYGLNPAGHHATNLLLHIASTIILFLALYRMTRSQWQSAFVAALFAVHPLHVESVAWIAERKDVLSTLFWMLTLLAYAYYAERPTAKRYAWVVSAFVFGLLSKPMLVTLPFVLLLLDYWPLRRLQTVDNRLQKGLARLVLEKIPLFVLAIGSSAMTYYAQQHGGAVRGLDEFPLGVRAANAVVVYIGYIWKMLWPTRLAVLYPHPGTTLPVWYVLGSMALLIGLTALALRAGRRHPYLTVGWLWYLGTLVPVIGLIQVGRQAMANRYTYVPLTGLFIMAAWGIPDMLVRMGVWGYGGKTEPERSTPNAQRPTSKGKPKPETRNPKPPDARPLPLAVASLVVVVVLAGCTWAQVGHWHDSLTLFDYAVKSTHGSSTALGNLGWAYTEKDDWKSAARYFKQGLKVRPDLFDLHYGLGICYRMTGEYDKAIKEYTEALRLNPESQPVRDELDRALRGGKETSGGANSTNYDLSMQHYNQAVTASEQGDSAVALREYKEAIRARPDFAEAYCNLGVLLKNQGDMPEAVKAYQHALKYKPSLTEAHNNLAVIFFMQGSYAPAWKEIHLAETYGFSPDPGFLDELSRKMPDPGQ
jgi:protein O-mannosyl-transferase